MLNEICQKVENFASLTNQEKFQIVLRDFENLLIISIHPEILDKVWSVDKFIQFFIFCYDK